MASSSFGRAVRGYPFLGRASHNTYLSRWSSHLMYLPPFTLKFTTFSHWPPHYLGQAPTPKESSHL